MIQNKMKGVESNQIKNISSGARPNSSGEEDLNKLDDYELDKRKAAMDEDFEKNRLRPGDADYVYDKEVEFNEGKIESGWDDEDDYSDPDF